MERIKINLVSKKPLKAKKGVKYGAWIFFLLAFLMGIYEVWIYAESKICIKQHMHEIAVKKKISQNIIIKFFSPDI